jgi:RNA polymerase sigma-70 factor (ECF subfamily)
MLERSHPVPSYYGQAEIGVVTMRIKKDEDFIPTRRSLLGRLKDYDDNQSWKTFFDTYWRLIYKAAIKAGLTSTEAEDVVQETVISVSKSMPNFDYDAQRGSFKTWLMQLTGWRIIDALRKRQPGFEPEEPSDSDEPPLEQLPDPAKSALETLWEEEWENNLMDAAIERIKTNVPAKQFQIFDLYVRKGWPLGKVSQALNVNRGQVYLVKHRVAKLIKAEVATLRSKPL